MFQDLDDPEMSMEDEFNFGPWEGYPLYKVLLDDPKFVAWCVREEIVEFDDEALIEIDKRGIV